MHKYVMTFIDGMTPIGIWQAMNFDEEAGTFTGDDVRHVATLAQARDQFAWMSRARMRDGVSTDDGGPSGEVYLAPLSPGDEPVYRIVQNKFGRARTVAA